MPKRAKAAALDSQVGALGTCGSESGDSASVSSVSSDRSAVKDLEPGLESLPHKHTLCSQIHFLPGWGKDQVSEESVFLVRPSCLTAESTNHLQNSLGALDPIPHVLC